MTYNRDMQEDKEAVFDSTEQLERVLAILAVLFENVNVRNLSEERLFGSDFSYATDIAEYLVRKGVAFRKAHQVAGSLVELSLPCGSSREYAERMAA